MRDTKEKLKMNQYKILALIGEAGTGKDTLMREVLKQDPSLHEIISCTTRPPREGEKNGKNYYFLDNEEFTKKFLSNEMLEATIFNNWWYGTSIDALDPNKVNIGVFNPAGIEALMTHSNVYVVVYYVRASAKNRLLRQLNREKNPDVDEIIRRYSTDNVDFDDLQFHYNEIENNNRHDLEHNVRILAAASKRLQLRLDGNN